MRVGEGMQTVCVIPSIAPLRHPLFFLLAVLLLLLLYHRSGGFPHAPVAEHQVHQVLLLPAGVGGDVAQQQVLAQVLHPELHEPGPLEGSAAQQVAGGAAAQVLLQHGAQRAETLLTVAADVLLEEDETGAVRESRAIEPDALTLAFSLFKCLIQAQTADLSSHTELFIINATFDE